MNNLEEKKFKKAKNFGYTFSFFFLVISIYTSLNKLYFLPYLAVFVLFTLTTLFFPIILYKPAELWQRFGFFLGKIFSPIILSIIYLLTIIPINILIRILNVDILQKKVIKKKKSYWINVKEKKIDFRSQF